MELILLLGAVGLAVYVSRVRADVARLRDEMGDIQRTMRSLTGALAAEARRRAAGAGDPVPDAPARPVAAEPPADAGPPERAPDLTPSSAEPRRTMPDAPPTLPARAAEAGEVPPVPPPAHRHRPMPRTPPPARSVAPPVRGERPGASKPPADAAPRQDAGTPAAAAGAASTGDASLDFETRVGTTWTLRIGLGAIAIAGALFARTIVPNLSNGAKVALAYAGALLLFGVGKIYESKLERFARPVMAGGLSLAFFVSFAAHFVPAMRAIPLVASLAWMTGGVLAVLLFATRWGSQPTAGLAIFLGHVSAFVAAGDANGYSLIAIAFLSVTAVVLLQRHGWLPLSLFAVVAAYASHLLWTIVAHHTLPAERALLLNLLFLSSYYGIFLAADLLWWRRQASVPDRERAPVLGRVLGPANLVFYVSLVSFLYVAMAGPPRPIEWFYFAVAALQGGLALAYRRLRNPDYGFYVALATVLLTIGFIAALDALALNLVLAVQALVLLLAAHRTRLRVFHLLAQVALLVNFLHYWTLGSPPVMSLAMFLGGLAIAAVYFTQSQLEEAWYAEGARAWLGGAEPPAAVRPIAERFDAVFGDFTRYLPYVHAVAGTAVLFHEILAYFPTGVEFGAVGVAFLLIVVGAAVRRSLPLSLAYLVAQGGIVLMARMVPAASLIGRMGIVAAGLAAPTFMVVMAARQAGSRFLGWTLTITQLGIWLAITVPVMLVPAASAPLPVTAQYLLWVGLAALVVVYAERLAELAGSRSPDPAASTDKTVAVATAILGALLITLVTDRVVGRGLAGPLWSSLWTAAFMAIAATRRSQASYAAGFTLLAATYAYLLAWLGLGPVVAASVAGSAAVIAVPLGIALVQDRVSNRRAAEGTGTWIDWATYTPYACASAFLAYVLHERVGGPWTGPLLTAFPLGLLLAARAFGLSRAVVVAIVMAFAAVVLQAVGLGGQGYPPWPGLVTLLAVVAVERMVSRQDRDDPDPVQDDGGISLLLVAAGAALALLAVHEAPWPPAAWVTTGWTLIGALMMGLALAWRASCYRTVALAVVFLAVLQHLRLLLAPGDAVALSSGLAPVLLVIAVERMVVWYRHRAPGAGSGDTWNTFLVLSGAGLALVALYRSAWPGVAWTTAGWSVLGAAMMVLGFAWRSAQYRRVALAVFALALVRVFAVDVRGLSSGGQTLAFLVLGVSLVAVAWLYARFSVTLRRWL